MVQSIQILKKKKLPAAPTTSSIGIFMLKVKVDHLVKIPSKMLFFLSHFFHFLGFLFHLNPNEMEI